MVHRLKYALLLFLMLLGVRLYASELPSFHALRHLNRSSPRATLVNFVESMTQAHRNAMLAVENDKQSPGWLRSEAAQAYAKQAELYLDRAIACLDLSDESLTNRENIGIESAILLKEILDRVPYNPMALPSESDLKRSEHERMKSIWRVGNSRLALIKITKGESQGEYLFSPETIKELYVYFDMVRAEPYEKRDTVTPNFFDFYAKSMGQLVPPKWNRWIPQKLNHSYYDQTIWQWFVLFLFGIIYVFLLLFIWKNTFSGEKFKSLYGAWKRVFVSIGSIAIYILSVLFLDYVLNITGVLLEAIRYIYFGTAYIMLAFLCIFLGLAINATLYSRRKNRHVYQIYAVLVSTLSFLCFMGVLFYSLDQVGFSLWPIVTSLGVIGLAIALSLRPVIANTVGMLMVYADKVYQADDFIRVINSEGTILAKGTVKRIGFRSTSIEQLDGEVVNLPNGLISDNAVYNSSQRRYIRSVIELRMVPREISPRFSEAIEIIQNTLSSLMAESANYDRDEGGESPTDYDEPQITFKGLDNKCVLIELVYWYRSSDWAKYKEFEATLNHRLLENFEKAEIKLV